MNSLKCMKARSLEVLKGFVESQQSESGSQLKLPVAEPMLILGSECMETRAAMLVQQLLRVMAARPVVRGRECRETMGSKS